MTVPDRYRIPCRARLHKVQLDPARFWSPARCPVCRTPIDPLRLRRLAMWLAGRAPWSRLRVGRVVITPVDLLAWLALAKVLAGATILWFGGDRNWLGTVALYTGRWPWLLPPLVVLPLALAWRRVALVPLAVALLVGLHAVMGFRVGFARFTGQPAPAERLRVLTYNVAMGERGNPSLQLIATVWQPDVLAIQECGPGQRFALRTLDGFHIDTTATCLASRHPIEWVKQMPNQQFHGPGGAGVVVTYGIRTPLGPVVLSNLHLETPRHGLQHLIQGSSLEESRVEIEANTLLREVESRQARRWVDSLGGPRIVVGDFNLPVESGIWQDSWASLVDAHEAAGLGFGFTRLNGWIRVRIDHVLTDGAWRPVRSTVGPDYGSDHLPVIVDLVPTR
ncbi:MAG TPA: endonuclease/exonuclease/phosphatase family protein [Gemmatimonadales bacterium]|nr:endonuclease/exonuclease/phosphatase family protein [Gemmatimonadales bacterium]